MPAPNPHRLERPYATLTPDDHTRNLQIRVRSEDWAAFQACYPVPGAIETIVTTLVHGIANELRTNGLVSWSSVNQQRFVAHIRRCATLRLAGLPVPPDDAGASTDAGRTTTQPTQEPTEVVQQDDRGDEREAFGTEGECDGGEGRKPFS